MTAIMQEKRLPLMQRVNFKCSNHFTSLPATLGIIALNRRAVSS
ncbi:hypothetical protein [Salinimicrobium sp. WS361]